ncbi:MAG: hypothetical protein JOZ82_00215, partial [Marmoricola sp.]|nr:hypothetical protein [Marmoricola sp.]
MLRRLRRPASVLVPLLLLVPALAACGSNSSGSSQSKGGISGVTLTGDVGKGITAKFHQKIAYPTSTKVTTLVKGSGNKIASGDTVTTYLWVGDGTTKKVAYSDYQNGKAEPIPNNGQLSPVFTKLFSGARYGSRVAAVTTPAELLGSSSGGAQL